MPQEIPYIAYNSKNSKIEGIEILMLEDLILKSNSLNHYPEKPHQLDFYLLVYYTEGETEHLVDFVWHKVQKNTLVYLAKGQVNAFKFNEDLKGYIILFTKEYFNEQLANIPKDVIIRLFTPELFTPVVQVPQNSNTESYIQLLFDEYYKDNFNNNTIIDALYIIIFSKIEQLKKQQTDYLKESDKLSLFLKFKTILEKEYSQSRNADMYAQRLNITYKHLNIVCKEIVNRTAKQFIDEYVVLEAKRKLINSPIKSTELAFLLGFEEPTNFVKYFKKHTGFTPNSFKNNHT